MAAGDNRGHGGNAGYDDQIDAYYSWDSNVPNHKRLRAGDPIALWDKEQLLGISVIEEIKTSRGLKLLNRCTECKTTRISERKRVEPKYRCMRCRHEFPFPLTEMIEVDLYQARYDAAWRSLDGLLKEAEIRTLSLHEGDINAMRPLNWSAFTMALHAKGAGAAVQLVTTRADLHWGPDVRIEVAPGGFTDKLVRVRRGQRQFREHLLLDHGNVCAFTGAAPHRVLEAGHLYSYADLGSHYDHGGLMLRRDIHRLFDDGVLAINPWKLRIDVAPSLDEYPQYTRLHDRPLHVGLADAHAEWLSLHWNEHRAG